MEDIEEEYHRSLEKQKSAIGSLYSEVDALIQLVEQCRQEIISNEKANIGNITQKLATTISSSYANVQKIHKDVHSTFTKLGKSIDKAMQQNQEQANKKPPNWTVDKGLINEIVAQHLYREGEFNTAEQFEQEAQIKVGEEYKQPFIQMFTVLQELQKRNIEPALQWCEENGLRDSQLAFRLHKLAFTQLLNASDSGASKRAIEYARQHFGRFAQQNKNEIFHLMGSVLYAGRLHTSPRYRELSLQDERAQHLWDDVANDLKRECCRISGKPIQPPLYVAVTAGSQALPTLIKLISVTQGKAGLDQVVNLNNSETLGVEIELDDSFQFHSIFACPVSKELSTGPDNPPVILPCGHVLLKSSVLKLVRSSHQRFKCPYCPTECAVVDCSPISF
jgi:hypothetical protein